MQNFAAMVFISTVSECSFSASTGIRITRTSAQQPQPVVEEEAAEAIEENGPRLRSEADLRGSLSNDSLTEDERKILEEDKARQEETARLRAEDYQLSYAIDILRGMSFLASNGN